MVCPVCGKEFVRVNNSQKYCSLACREKVYRKPAIKKCARCGVEINVAGTSRKYCLDCAYEVAVERQKEYQRARYYRKVAERLAMRNEGNA